MVYKAHCGTFSHGLASSEPRPRHYWSSLKSSWQIIFKTQACQQPKKSFQARSTIPEDYLKKGQESCLREFGLCLKNKGGLTKYLPPSWKEWHKLCSWFIYCISMYVCIFYWIVAPISKFSQQNVNKWRVPQDFCTVLSYNMYTMEQECLVLGDFLSEPFHSLWLGQVCHLLTWPKSGQSDMTLLAYVPPGNSTWIRYRKEASQAIV